jgi:hypothetical protein
MNIRYGRKKSHFMKLWKEFYTEKKYKLKNESKIEFLRK